MALLAPEKPDPEWFAAEYRKGATLRDLEAATGFSYTRCREMCIRGGLQQFRPRHHRKPRAD